MDIGRIVANCPEEVHGGSTDVELVMLEPCDGPIMSRSYRFTENLDINDVELNTKLQIAAETPADRVVVSIRKDMQSSLLLNRYLAGPGQPVITINNGSETTAIASAGYRGLVVSISRAVLERSELYGNFDEDLLASTHLFEISGMLHQILLDQTQAAIEADDDSLEDNVADVILTLLASVSKIESIGTTNRIRIVASSIRHIRSHADEALEIDDLAELAHCSVRTLQYAFRKTIGLSPNQYLRRYRLNRVRKVILNEGRHDSGDIANVARRYGFKHAGHFSRMYKDLFSNRPSDGCDCAHHVPQSAVASID